MADKEQKKSDTGFAGLSSMVSDVESDIEYAEKQTQNSTKPLAPSDITNTSTSSTGEEMAQDTQSSKHTPEPKGKSYGRECLLGIAVVIGVFWFFSKSGKEISSSSEVHIPRTEPAIVSPIQEPATVSAPETSPPVFEPQLPDRLSEVRPSVGRGNTLDAAQIRYCLAEDIRMTASKGSMNQYKDADVDQFNRAVLDFNSRCSNFMYRQGALESARTQVEAYRVELEAEGLSRFIRSAPSSQPVLIEPHQETAANRIPQNAQLDYTGSNWTCRVGYKKISGECVPVQMPLNAELDYTGSNWKCRAGYKQVNGECVSVQIPMNAELDYTGSNWKCRVGYKQVSRECVPVQIPQDAELDYTGSNWKCKTGFKRAIDACVPV